MFEKSDNQKDESVNRLECQIFISFSKASSNDRLEGASLFSLPSFLPSFLSFFLIRVDIHIYLSIYVRDKRRRGGKEGLSLSSTSDEVGKVEKTDSLRLSVILYQKFRLR